MLSAINCNIYICNYLLKEEKKLNIPASIRSLDAVQFNGPSRIFSQLELSVWQLTNVELGLVQQ